MLLEMNSKMITKRRIIAEDLDWSVVTVPNLSVLCLLGIVRNFEGENLF